MPHGQAPRRRHAHHRAVRFAADQEPFLGVARDAKEAEGLRAAVDVDLALDEKIVAQDGNGVPGLGREDLRRDDLRDAVAAPRATLSRLSARPVSITSLRAVEPGQLILNRVGA